MEDVLSVFESAGKLAEGSINHQGMTIHMDLNKALRCTGLLAVLGVCGVVMPANADAGVFTASIDRAGNVLEQSPDWIADVEHNAQPNYFSDYKVKFVPGLLDRAPRFCSVSSTDVSSNDNIFYGHAKLGGAPTADKVNVLTLNVGGEGPAGDSSLSFMLMCVK
ncbi:hypothetical protein [Pseudomonas fluorescens]|uniref:hypothetical protein n=1 Tax=Pseudomonas fluorescens TaxID=294 RepID=UPI0039902089